MRVKMKTLMAGPDGIRKPDTIHDLPTAEAEALIAGDYAEKVERAAKPEAAEPRTATRGRGRTAAKPEAADADEANPAEAGEEADEA